MLSSLRFSHYTAFSGINFDILGTLFGVLLNRLEPRKRNAAGAIKKKRKKCRFRICERENGFMAGLMFEDFVNSSM